MSSSAKKWISRIIKIGVCAAALLYLSTKVTLLDRVRLANDPEKQWALISETGDQMQLRDPETREERTVSRSELARSDQLAPGQRSIEPGLRSIVRRADPTWTLWSLLAMGPITFILAKRLQWLLDTQEIFLSYRDALLLTFAGNFFNFAMPGTTGGDLYKAYHIARRTHKRTEGITVVLLDRVIGLVSFLLLAGAAIAVSWRTNLIGEYGRWVGYMLVAFFAGCAMFFSRRFRRLIAYEKLLARLPLADKLQRIDETALSLRYHRKDAVLSLLVTLFSHLLLVTGVYFLARALGIHPSAGRSEAQLFQATLLSTVVGYLLAAIPISIQGFGLLELVFQRVLVDGHWCGMSQMLALTLGTRLVQIVWSLPGFFVPWLGFKRPVEKELSESEPPADGAHA